MLKKILVPILLVLINFSFADITSFNIGEVPVLYMQNNFLPQIDIRCVIELGTIDDPVGKPGLINFMTQGLMKGTKKYTKQDLAFMLDNNGIQLDTVAGREYIVVSLKLLKDKLPLAKVLLSEILTKAKFPEKEMFKLKDDLIGNIKMNQTDPSWIASSEFHDLLFAKTPYKGLIEGNIDSISKFDLADVKAVYQNVFQKRPMFLVVVGDITKEEIKTEIGPVFTDYHVSNIRQEKYFQIEDKVCTVTRDLKLEQNHIFLGSKGILRSNPDYFSVLVLNQILGGGGLTSRLMQKVREENGLAYSVYSIFDIQKYLGAFYINLQTKNASKDQAISLVKKEIRDIKANGVEKEEFELVKNYLRDSFLLRIESNSQIANYLVYIGHFGLPLNYFDYFPQMIEKLTIEDVNKAAKKYLPDQYLEYILGR